MTPPRRPSRLTWPVLSRLLGRVLAGLALVWVVALVAWPEKHTVTRVLFHRSVDILVDVGQTPGAPAIHRDSSLAVILGKLGR